MLKIQNHFIFYGVKTVLATVLLAFLVVASLLLVKFNQPVHATSGINETLNYQGRLLTAAGAVVPDGSYNMEFKIVKGGDGCNPTSGTFPCSGTVQWTETRESSNKVLVKNGYFSVYLGSVTAFNSDVDWNDDTLWLSINIGGTDSPSYDGEMKPLTRLSATPYALNSKYLGGLQKTSFIQLAQGVQTDSSSTNPSIYINKTGSANILTLQASGVDKLTLDTSGNQTLAGDLTVSGGDIKGPSGGLTVTGGSGASDNLVLKSTSNSTKGNIVLDDNVVQFSADRTFTSSPVFLDLAGGSSRTHTIDTSNAAFTGLRFYPTIQLQQSANPLNMGALFDVGATIKNVSGVAANLGPFYTLNAGAIFVADGASVTQALNYDIYAHPLFKTLNSGTLSVTDSRQLNAAASVGTGVTITNRTGVFVGEVCGDITIFQSCTTNLGTVTNQIGLRVEPLANATNNAGVVIGEAGGTKQTNLLIGTTTQPSGSWSVYNSSTDANYFAGVLGINTTGADRKLDVLDSSNPQLRLTHTDGSVYADLQTDSNGYLILTNSGNRVVIGTVDATGTLLVLDTKNTSGDPTGTDGAMYYNSNSKTFRCYENGTWRNCIGGLVFANTTVTNTVSNTNSETDFNQNYTIPANDCTPGRVYRVTAQGTYGSASSGNLRLKLKLGTTVVTSTNSGQPGASQAADSRGWRVEAQITCITAGSSGSVEAHGFATIATTNGSSAQSREMFNTSAITVNTTTSQTLQLSALWSVADSANTITMRQIIVEAIGP